MTSKEKINRTVQISVRLEPKILEGLNEISDRLGIKQSTVAGYAIGEFVTKNQAAWANQTSIQRMMVEEMAKIIGGPLAAIFDGKSLDEMKRLFVDDEKPEKQVDWIQEEKHD